MRPSVRRLEERYEGRIDFHSLNIDQVSSAELISKYRVAGVPTIVLLDAQGEVFSSFLGYLTEEELTAMLEALLADHAARTP